MTDQRSIGRRFLLVPAVLMICGVGGAAIRSSLVSGASAQDDAAPAEAARVPQSEKVIHHVKKHEAKSATTADAATSVSPQGAVAAPVAAAQPAAAGGAPISFASSLKEHGAGTCAAQVDALAGTTMGGVQAFNTMSNWSARGGGDRLVSVAIGQKYTSGTPVPYGTTSVVAAPNAQGGCDSITVQVVPSALSCPKLRDTMAASGGHAADLAGIPVVQDASGQTMLIPTAANTCVLVNQKVVYAK